MSDGTSGPEQVVTYTYDNTGPVHRYEYNPADAKVDDEPLTAPPPVRFEHDAKAGVFRLTAADGAVEVFRDKPTRYLCVEPDDETGEMRPVMKFGRPVFVYLCREEREVR